MLTGHRFVLPPFRDVVFNGVYDLGMSNEAMDLLERIFRLDPNNRLTLSQILEHPWVTQHNEDNL
jgi:serine/threonine protein kinase